MMSSTYDRSIEPILYGHFVVIESHGCILLGGVGCGGLGFRLRKSPREPLTTVVIVR